MGEVITAELMGLSKAEQLPYARSLCGACREVGAVKIDIPELLLHLRAEVVEETASATAAPNGPMKRKPAERLAFRLYAFVWSSRRRYEWGLRIARLLQRFVVRKGRIDNARGFISRLVPPLRASTPRPDPPPLPAPPSPHPWPHNPL